MLTPGRQYKNGVKLQGTYSVSSENWRIARCAKSTCQSVERSTGKNRHFPFVGELRKQEGFFLYIAYVSLHH